jgi:hypothetical protein
MSSNWTEEQTKESVKKQSKALFTTIPIIIIIFFLAIYVGHEIIYGDDYQRQYEQLVTEGHLEADFTTEELEKFCNSISGTSLDNKFFDVCFWID